MQLRTGYDYPLRLAAIALLLGGCFLVLQPFIAAILLAGVIASTTWPFFARLRRAMGERSGLAAMAMVLLLIVGVVLPLALLAGSFAGHVTLLLDSAKEFFEAGLPEAPDWVSGIPLVGPDIAKHWHAVVSDHAQLKGLVQHLAEPARKMLLGLGSILGQGVFQMLMVALIGFFFYRDGEDLADRLRSGTGRIAGQLTEGLLETVSGTMAGVMNGILGTALAQAAVATIGFVIAGVPAAFVLGAATFFLSLVPAGTVVVWGGAAVWLYYKVSVGWAIFMVLWGTFVISTIDNFLKPMLISRGSNLSLLVVALGIFGGILAFGFVGIFLGPALLAIGVTVLQHWLSQRSVEVKSESPRTPEA
jgi:predicted PurR-regulated permease PerM